MTEVWLVRYDQGLYLFANLEDVEVSIRDMYPTNYSIEKEEISDQQYVYQIMHNDRVQDRIATALYEVHEKPTVIHQEVASEPTPRKVRKEF